MSTRCPDCGYGPIAAYTDNCPICGCSVRSDAERDPRSGGVGQLPLPPGLTAGLVGIVLLHMYLFWDTGAWMLPLMALPAGAFLALAREKSPKVFRIVGASYLVVLVVGMWVASQTKVLPRLGGVSPFMPGLPDDLADLVQGQEKIPPQVIAMFRQLPRRVWVPFLRHWFVLPQTPARFLVWHLTADVVYLLVIVPPVVLLFPFWQRRRHRRPWFPALASWAGLVVWLLILVAVAGKAPGMWDWFLGNQVQPGLPPGMPFQVG